MQKGNAPEERKLQRLFRNPEVTRLIKRCNDFGAGGVSVAIGELADGLDIDLNAVPKKYEGLDGTELAISESQERMAVVVAARGRRRASWQLAAGENLEATVVATGHRQEPPGHDLERPAPSWTSARAFLNTNGADKHITARAPLLLRCRPARTRCRTSARAAWTLAAGPERLPPSGACPSGLTPPSARGTVLMPFGGKYSAHPHPGHGCTRSPVDRKGRPTPAR